ncbi:MAG TPA: response regulator, partial [Gemmatimonadaceae bacterium]|nr:response regulator [Gemmatimonadaceae bacterium]
MATRGVLRSNRRWRKRVEERVLATGCNGYIAIALRHAPAVGTDGGVPRGGRMRVLIVDDNAINRTLLRVTLRSGGHETVEAADGVEALEKLRSEKFDAVISDILMPRMDGYRFCYEVRRDPKLRDVPIVVYSSTYTSPGDAKLAL